MRLGLRRRRLDPLRPRGLAPRNLRSRLRRRRRHLLPVSPRWGGVVAAAAAPAAFAASTTAAALGDAAGAATSPSSRSAAQWTSVASWSWDSCAICAEKEEGRHEQQRSVQHEGSARPQQSHDETPMHSWAPEAPSLAAAQQHPARVCSATAPAVLLSAPASPAGPPPSRPAPPPGASPGGCRRGASRAGTPGTQHKNADGKKGTRAETATTTAAPHRTRTPQRKDSPPPGAAPSRPAARLVVCNHVLPVPPLDGVHPELQQLHLRGRQGANDVRQQAPAVEAADLQVIVYEALGRGGTRAGGGGR